MKTKVLNSLLVCFYGVLIASCSVPSKDVSTGCVGNVSYGKVNAYVFDINNRSPTSDDWSKGNYVWSNDKSDAAWREFNQAQLTKAMRGAVFVRHESPKVVWHTLSAVYRTDSGVCVISFDFTEGVKNSWGNDGYMNSRHIVYVNGDIYSVEGFIDGIFYDGLQKVGYMPPTVYE
jgi:hypothetical protein